MATVSALGRVHVRSGPKSVPPGHQHDKKDQNIHRCHAHTTAVQAHSTALPYAGLPIRPCCFAPMAGCAQSSSRPAGGHKNTQLGHCSNPKGPFLPRIAGRGPECQTRLHPQFGGIMSPNREGAVSSQRDVVCHRRGASGNGHAMAVRMNLEHTSLATWLMMKNTSGNVTN